MINLNGRNVALIIRRVVVQVMLGLREIFPCQETERSRHLKQAIRCQQSCRLPFPLTVDLFAINSKIFQAGLGDCESGHLGRQLLRDPTKQFEPD